MQVLKAPDVLAAWECLAGRPASAEALELLAAASPERSGDELAELTVGERDRRLLALRERFFGRRMDCVAICDECGERMQFTADVGTLLSAAEDIKPEAAASREHEIASGGFRLRFRLPAAHDLVALDGCEPGEARLLLLRRCVSSVERPEGDPEQIAPETLPPEVVDAVSERMARADPHADLSFALQCPGCAASCEVAFDIASFLVAEIQTCAQRLFEQVHVLAASYGWPESEILAMSPSRRRAYLEFLGCS